MPTKYDQETKAKAVRLVGDHRDEYDTEWAAMRAISARLGMSGETLRKWVRRADIDDGHAAGISTAESQEPRELRKKTRELEQTTDRSQVNRCARNPRRFNGLGCRAADAGPPGADRWPFLSDLGLTMVLCP